MNISGLAGLCLPEKLEYCIEHLNALPGIEVYSSDPHTGRMVIVQEAISAQQEAELFRRMSSIDGMLSLNLVCHHAAESAPDTEQSLPVPNCQEESST